jgi:hypothetical protein
MQPRGCSVVGNPASSWELGTGGVAPLGVFGILAGQRDMAEMRSELQTGVGAIAPSEREAIANYLRSSSIVIALMEHTRDVLGNEFAVPGGSAIHTDGVFYWRRDAADYVYHYGVGLPLEFLELGRGSHWLPRLLSRKDVLAIDDYLSANVRRFSERRPT